MAAAVTIYYAKTNLSKLIARVEAGEEVVIMRGKNPGRAAGADCEEERPTIAGMLKGKIPDLARRILL